ncbi:small-conductance mechanosensitive channel [Mycobacteroides chelonae]|nr:small-conductance mechanosensitive channel [Mycobacteroides chelonae]
MRRIIVSAGIVGVALGFGAQNLVRAFNHGHLHVVEDPMAWAT